MEQEAYEQSEYEGVSTLHWAKRQLRGVIREDDPRYRQELLRVGLIFLDSVEMDMGESYGFRSYASEQQPQSYSWLV